MDELEKLAILRARDTRVIQLIEAIQEIQSTDAWSTLKEEFDGEIARLNRLLLTESKKKEIDLPEVYRLQGRIESTKKFSFEKLYADLMTEHDNIKRKL